MSGFRNISYWSSHGIEFAPLETTPKADKLGAILGATLELHKFKLFILFILHPNFDSR
jgi:hypothetical protein